MARSPTPSDGQAALSASVEDLLLAARNRGGTTLETGRYIVTFKQGAVNQGIQSLKDKSLKTMDARDFSDQAVSLESVSDAEALVFPEIGAAVVAGPAYHERGLSAASVEDPTIQTIEPEYFAFADNVTSEYLRGFTRAVSVITADWDSAAELNEKPQFRDVDTQVLGVTWGLSACRVPLSQHSGAGIKVAVLDTGMDLGHPDFAGRAFTTQSFIAGEPVDDLNSHGTHCIGTSCGPLAPAGNTQRYGIAYKAPIFVGKVLSNAGGGTTATVLAGMNWAIAQRCAVISMSLGGQAPVQAAYTAAGQAALAAGCLIIAAAGNAGAQTGAPANSPTIMSVASLSQQLTPSVFSNFGKVEISGPGENVFSSVPRPILHGVKSGTSMATPHVAGCAALLAESNPAFRGQALWNELLRRARALPGQPPARVGHGLVQAP